MTRWPWIGKPVSTSVQVGQFGLQSFPALVVLKTRPSSAPAKIVFGADGAMATELTVILKPARSDPMLRQPFPPNFGSELFGSPPVVVSKTLPGVVTLFTSVKVASPSTNRV